MKGQVSAIFQAGLVFGVLAFGCSCSTPIAKPIRTSNPYQRIMAFDKVADISEIVRVMLRLFITLSFETNFGS